MRSKTLVVVVAAWLPALFRARCVAPPPSKVDHGERFSYTIARSPYPAAICIARNAKHLPGNLEVQERLLGDSSTEVVVNSRGGEAGTLAIAKVHRAGSLSRVSVWVSSLVPDNRESFARRLIGDCSNLY
jgi:hypothetical protein